VGRTERRRAGYVADNPRYLRPVVAHPDFIIIGAQKAGTSWLHTNLRRHPAIWMPGTEMHAWRDWALPKYMDYYERPEPVTGEKGPEYFHMPGYAVKRMASDLPATTFIALLRRVRAGVESSTHGGLNVQSGAGAGRAAVVYQRP